MKNGSIFFCSLMKNIRENLREGTQLWLVGEVWFDRLCNLARKCSRGCDRLRERCEVLFVHLPSVALKRKRRAHWINAFDWCSCAMIDQLFSRRTSSFQCLCSWNTRRRRMTTHCQLNHEWKCFTRPTISVDFHQEPESNCSVDPMNRPTDAIGT